MDRIVRALKDATTAAAATTSAGQKLVMKLFGDEAATLIQAILDAYSLYLSIGSSASTVSSKTDQLKADLFLMILQIHLMVEDTLLPKDALSKTEFLLISASNKLADQCLRSTAASRFDFRKSADEKVDLTATMPMPMSPSSLSAKVSGISDAFRALSFELDRALEPYLKKDTRDLYSSVLQRLGDEKFILQVVSNEKFATLRKTIGLELTIVTEKFADTAAVMEDNINRERKHTEKMRKLLKPTLSTDLTGKIPEDVKVDALRSSSTSLPPSTSPRTAEEAGLPSLESMLTENILKPYLLEWAVEKKIVSVLHFLLAVSEYRVEAQSSRQKAATKISKKYLKKEGEECIPEIYLPTEIRSKIYEKLEGTAKLRPNFFDEAYKASFSALERVYIEDFKASPAFKKLSSVQ